MRRRHGGLRDDVTLGDAPPPPAVAATPQHPGYPIFLNGSIIKPKVDVAAVAGAGGVVPAAPAAPRPRSFLRAIGTHLATPAQVAEMMEATRKMPERVIIPSMMGSTEDGDNDALSEIGEESAPNSPASLRADAMLSEDVSWSAGGVLAGVLSTMQHSPTKSAGRSKSGRKGGAEVSRGFNEAGKPVTRIVVSVPTKYYSMPIDPEASLGAWDTGTPKSGVGGTSDELLY